MALAGSGMKAYLVGMAAVHAVSLGLVLFWLTRGEAVSAADVRRALIPPAVSIGVAAAAVELTRRAAVPGDHVDDDLRIRRRRRRKAPADGGKVGIGAY